MKYNDDEYYHVFNRGAHKEHIFFSEQNYQYCIRLLEKYRKEYSVSLLCYCLMPNHYHLLVRQENGGSISRFLQTSFNAYTQAINKERNQTGTLFEGRAKGILVDSEKYLLQLARYIHMNPVNAGLVKQPEDWEYSDYRRWIYAPKAGGLNVELRDLYFNNGDEYKNFIQAYVKEHEDEQLRNYLFVED